jgi:hypothetical protein
MSKTAEFHPKYIDIFFVLNPKFKFELFFTIIGYFPILFYFIYRNEVSRRIKTIGPYHLISIAVL